jgi:protein TonB
MSLFRPKKAPVQLPPDADFRTRRAAQKEEKSPKLALALTVGVGAHLVIFLFGGMLIPKHEAAAEAKKVVVENVQLEQQKEEPKNEERPQDEPPPPSDTEEQVQNLSQAAAAQDAAPAMANLSLSDLSSALGGASGDSMGTSSAGLGGVGFAGGTGTGGAGLGGGGGMVSSADLDNKPTVTTRVNPKPVKGVAGKVKLLLVVGSDGSVAEVKTLESDHPDLLRNCVSAVRQWRFKPGMRDGRPVPFKMHQPFSFQG